MNIKIILGPGKDPITAGCFFEEISVFPQVVKELDLTKERKRKKYVHSGYVAVHAKLRILNSSSPLGNHCQGWVFQDNNKMQWVACVGADGIRFISTGRHQKTFTMNITEMIMIYSSCGERTC